MKTEWVRGQVPIKLNGPEVSSNVDRMGPRVSSNENRIGQRVNSNENKRRQWQLSIRTGELSGVSSQ